MKTKTSKYLGVSFCKENGKWKASMRINSKSKFLGYFENEEEAAEAYQKTFEEVYAELPLKAENDRLKIPAQVRAVVAEIKRNSGPRRDNKTGLKGISWHKKLQKYQALITDNDGKLYHLGYFEDKLDAARAWDAEARRIRGPNAYQNFILRTA